MEAAPQTQHVPYFFLSMTPSYVLINTRDQNRNVLSMKASILDLALYFIYGVASVGTGH